MPELSNIGQLAQKLKRLEQELNDAVRDIAAQVTDGARNASLPGVKKLSPRICLVSASSLMGSPWSPEYWSAEAQADYIKSALAGAQSFSKLVSTLDRLTSKERSRFHPEILKILDDTLDQISPDKDHARSEGQVR